MTDEHTLTLQEITAEREWWRHHAGEHYRELARNLRAVAAKCRFPYTRRELADLARAYECRAEQTELGAGRPGR